MHQILQPEGWARPVGYSNGLVEPRAKVEIQATAVIPD